MEANSQPAGAPSPSSPPPSTTAPEETNSQLRTNPFLPPPPHKSHFSADDVPEVDEHNDTAYSCPIPPPENVEVNVEDISDHSDRDPAEEGSRRCNSYICLIVSTLLILIMVFGTTIKTVFELTLNPENPKFHIKKLIVEENETTANTTIYRLIVEVVNPNGVNDVALRTGIVTLVFDGDEIAHGDFPNVYQDPKDVDEAEVMLIGKKWSSLPKQVQKRFKGSVLPDHDSVKDVGVGRNKTTARRDGEKVNVVAANIPLSVELKVSLIKKTWMMNKYEVVDVECTILASSLVPNKKNNIVPQMCHYTSWFEMRREWRG